MGTSEDERAFLDDVSFVDNDEVCFLPVATGEAAGLLTAVRDSDSWVGSDRPDFYSNDHQIAIEVMRVDDHPNVGKITNPTLAREREIEREVRASFPALDADVRVTVIADTGLASDADHNFNAYRQAFTRIVTDHSQKVETYRDRHPEYTLALLIRDESSAYARVERDPRPAVRDELIAAEPHYWFLDDHFTRVIAKSNADYVIWSTPYKHAWHIDAQGRRLKVQLPAVAIYDVAAMLAWHDALIYEPSRMQSLEE
ncbi:hypothetical protein ACWPKO_30120 (plasmid) [Coraliomargarita sp. W4R53]